jgi:DNA-directed RNA polymerase specialized sigma24 family protein
VLKALPPRMRETLIRFYLEGQSEEEIRAAMGMSHNQFRLIKSRAKVRYVELVQHSMNRAPNRSPDNVPLVIPLTATSWTTSA